MTSFLTTVGLVLGFVAASFGASYACTCDFRSHRTDFRNATAVFIGTVTEIADLTPPQDIRDMRPQLAHFLRVRVEKRYKGELTEQIWSYEIPYACGGFEFKVGDKYLLYVYKAEEGSRYASTSCTRSRNMAAGGELLEDELRDLNRWTFRFWSRVWPF
jgi:hypothetical protein